MFDFIQQKSRYFGLAATLLLAGSVLLAGCGSSGQSGDAGAKKIIIGTGHAYEPYCYLDQEGHLTGYEYEVLKAVDELLPQYAFEYQTFDFANVLMALESGKVTVEGDVVDVTSRTLAKRGSAVLCFDITDRTNSVRVSRFLRSEDDQSIIDKVKKGDHVVVQGEIIYSKYDDDMVLDPRNTYDDPKTWTEHATDLAHRFEKNFVKYKQYDKDGSLEAAGPIL